MPKYVRILQADSLKEVLTGFEGFTQIVGEIDDSHIPTNH